MGLNGRQIHDKIVERKDRQAEVKREAMAGSYDPPPLLAGLTPLSAIQPPRLVSDAQKKRNVLDKIATIERVLRNCKLTPAERERLAENLEGAEEILGVTCII